MSSHKIKGIIFDLDGTLLDTLGDLTTAVNRTATQYHQPTLTKQQVASNIGNGFVVTITKSLPGIDTKEIPAAVAQFKLNYSKVYHNDSPAYPGIDQLLDQLQKESIKLCVVSNKVQDYVLNLIHLRFPQIHFDLIYGDHEMHLRKPDPQGLLEACTAMNLSVDEVLMIGDSNADVYSAASIGMEMIAVSWGFSSVKALNDAGAKSFIHNAHELFEALESYAII